MAAAPDLHALTRGFASGRTAFVLAIGALAAVFACAFRVATYEGPALFGYLATGLALAGGLLTVAAFVSAIMAMDRDIRPVLAGAALACALGAWPVAFGLEMLTLVVLNSAGIFW